MQIMSESRACFFMISIGPYRKRSRGNYIVEKKKNLYNLIMAAAILVILAAGMMTAGHLRGWFGGGTVVTGADGSQSVVEILVQSKKGNVDLVRGGVSFPLEKDASLRDGDRIETRRGSEVTLVSGGNTLYLDERSQAALQVTEEGQVCLALETGGIFGVVTEPFSLTLLETEITAEEAVFSASAPYGSAGMHIFEHMVLVDGQKAEAGQAVNIIPNTSSGEGARNEIQITDLSLQSLNSFELACAALTKGHTLCFTAREMEDLTAQRQQAVADAGSLARDGRKEDQDSASGGDGADGVKEGVPAEGSGDTSGGSAGVPGGSGDTPDGGAGAPGAQEAPTQAQEDPEAAPMQEREETRAVPEQVQGQAEAAPTQARKDPAAASPVNRSPQAEAAPLPLSAIQSSIIWGT